MPAELAEAADDDGTLDMEIFALAVDEELKYVRALFHGSWVESPGQQGMREAGIKQRVECRGQTG